MKRLLKFIGVVLTLAAALTLGACGSVVSGSEMSFSFSTDTPANSTDEKSITLSEDMENLTIKGDIKVDSGAVTVRVVDTMKEDAEAEIWRGDFGEDTVFNIPLVNLKKDNEYLVKVEALQSKMVSLKLTSDTKLVLDKEMPEKPTVKE